METTKYGTFYFANFLFFLTFKVLLAIHFHFHFITITNMRTALLIFLVVIVCAQPKLNYLSGNQAKASVEDLVNRFASLQTEIYKKVF